MGQPLPSYDDEDRSGSDYESPSRDHELSNSDSDAPEMVTQENSKRLARLQRSSEMQSQRYLKEQRKKRLRALAEQIQKSSKEKIEAAKSQKLSGDIIQCIQDVLEDHSAVEENQEDDNSHSLPMPRPQRIVRDGFELQSLASARISSQCGKDALEVYKLDATRHKRSITYRSARPAAQFIAERLHQ